jgi:nucleoside 2-deoxyribosyltransferase
MDLADIRRADVMLLINKEEWENKGTGGRHFETGYAIAHQIPVLIYGKRSHALQYHELIYTVPEGSSVRHILDQLWWMNAKIKPRRKSTRISRHRREDARDSCEEKP